MTPEKFPEANITFGPPSELEESQCQSVSGYRGQVQGGSCDGLQQVIVAYRFTQAELEFLMEKKVIYLSMIGELAPHFLSYNFHQASHPA